MTSFVLGNDEIVVSHTKVGSIGSWGVDPDLRLKFGDETTEWITIESVGRVLDEAIAITARRMVDTEEQLKATSMLAVNTASAGVEILTPNTSFRLGVELIALGLILEKRVLAASVCSSSRRLLTAAKK